MAVSQDAVLAAVAVAAVCLLVQAWIWFMARVARRTLASVDDRCHRSERDRITATRAHSSLVAELSGVHQHAQAVLRAVRESPDTVAIRAACLAAVEPILLLRQATSSAPKSRRPVVVNPPSVPPAPWVDGSVAVAFAIVLAGTAGYLPLNNVMVAAGSAAGSGLVALVLFRRVFETRRDIEEGLLQCREFDVAARDAGTTRDLQRAYGEYLNNEVGRFLLALGNGHLPLDDGTRDAARVLGLRLEAAFPPDLMVLSRSRLLGDAPGVRPRR